MEPWAGLASKLVPLAEVWHLLPGQGQQLVPSQLGAQSPSSCIAMGGNTRRIPWLSVSSTGEGLPKNPKVGGWASREPAQ